jgi:four helix bundle protein
MYLARGSLSLVRASPRQICSREQKWPHSLRASHAVPAIVLSASFAFRRETHDRQSGVIPARARGMAPVRRFEDLVAWQLCGQLAEVIARITERGPCTRDAEFCNQIRDAANAAAPLIAEGFLRFTPDEFVRYLRMARGELGEVQSRLYEGERRRYFTPAEISEARPLANRAMATTTNLLKSKLPLLQSQSNRRRARRRGSGV